MMQFLPQSRLACRHSSSARLPLRARWIQRQFQCLSTTQAKTAYHEHYQDSIERPEVFWKSVAQDVSWFDFPTNILQDNVRWFSDGTFNTCFNCLDVHVRNGRGSQDAIIFDSPILNVKQRLTYQELLDETSRFAGVLQSLGVQTGDRVLIYMPMIPEAIVAMLACARIGAIHSVVFGGFAAKELAARIADSQPRVVVSASAGVLPGRRVVSYKPLLDHALEMAKHNVEASIIVQRPELETCNMGELDLDYHDLMSSASPVEAKTLPANHPHFILYTSGTTGIPKGVVHDTAPTAVAWKYSMEAFYGVKPGDVFWTASDIGWIVGHAYIVYAPLLNGNTSILYEGKPVGTPDAGAFWRVIEEYQAKALFTAPTALRAIRQADPEAKLMQQYDLSAFRTLFLAGEHSDPATLQWCEKALNVPAIDHWWQTELCYPGAGNSMGLLGIASRSTRYGACAAAVPGYNLQILDDGGLQVPHGTLGSLVIKQPLPPGSLTTLYNNHDRFLTEYMSRFPGYYQTGDAAHIDRDGYIYIMGRQDDIINCAGHRLSTGAMEEILMSHPAVAECAVIGVNDDLKGHVPVGFVVIKAGVEIEETILEQELVKMVRENVGAIACFHKAAVVKNLPKTRSGKILRGTMAKMANRQSYKVTPTIEDHSVLEAVELVIRRTVA